MFHSFALILAVSTLVRSPLPADFRPTQLHVESSWNGLAAQLPPAVDIDCVYAHLTWSCKGGWDGATLDAIVSNAAQSVASYDADGFTHAQWRAAAAHITRDDARATVMNVFFPSKANAYAVGKSDDYPHVAVKVRDASGNSLSIESDSYWASMLPWHITYDKDDVYFSHVAVSRAVATLLPEGGVNRARLLDPVSFCRSVREAVKP